ncbi:MAG: hypothetical protein RR714_06510, partial [Aurantimicrobium sp.]
MTLQLELGKKYLNRRGEVVEIVKQRDDFTWPWLDEWKTTYTENGKWFPGEENLSDLISEYAEPSTKHVETTTKV